MDLLAIAREQDESVALATSRHHQDQAHAQTHQPHTSTFKHTTAAACADDDDHVADTETAATTNTAGAAHSPPSSSSSDASGDVSSELDGVDDADAACRDDDNEPMVDDVPLVPRTKHEIPEDAIPIVVPQLILAPDEPLEKAAVLTTIVGCVAVFKALPGLPPMQEGTVLCLPPAEAATAAVMSELAAAYAEEVEGADDTEGAHDKPTVDDGRPRIIGAISEIFGPVSAPFYSVRFGDEKEMSALGLAQGLFASVPTRHADFLSTAVLSAQKWTDASGANDEEASCEEFSDDEEEQEASRRRAGERAASRDCAETRLAGAGPAASKRPNKRGRRPSAPGPRQPPAPGVRANGGATGPPRTLTYPPPVAAPMMVPPPPLPSHMMRPAPPPMQQPYGVGGRPPLAWAGYAPVPPPLGAPRYPVFQPPPPLPPSIAPPLPPAAPLARRPPAPSQLDGTFAVHRPQGL